MGFADRVFPCEWRNEVSAMENIILVIGVLCIASTIPYLLMSFFDFLENRSLEKSTKAFFEEIDQQKNEKS